MELLGAERGLVDEKKVNLIVKEYNFVINMWANGTDLFGP